MSCTYNQSGFFVLLRMTAQLRLAPIVAVPISVYALWYSYERFLASTAPAEERKRVLIAVTRGLVGRLRGAYGLCRGPWSVDVIY